MKPVKDWPSRLPANPDRSIRTATVVMWQTGLVDISRFSSWNRFYSKQRQSSSPDLTTYDFQLATETLLRQSQLASFQAVLEKLLRKEPLSSKEKLLSLYPFIDERQIIRSSGRLQYAPLPAATRMTVVLDAQNAIIRLLLLHFHEICHHAGPEYVMHFCNNDISFLASVRLYAPTVIVASNAVAFEQKTSSQ